MLKKYRGFLGFNIMDNKLYVLPNGAGVDPSVVMVVNWLDKSEMNPDIIERVVVYLSQSPGSIVIYCESLDHARTMCEKIINDLNELR